VITSKSSLSRREVTKWAAVAGAPLAGPAAAAQNSDNNICWFSGLTEAPVTYFDVIEPTGGRTGKPPMFLIHGGGHTGACYLMTADGRPGWAHAFAQAGYRVVIPDWPGSGRSGYVPYDGLTGETVVAGLGKALLAVGEPAVVMTHSMSGPYTPDDRPARLRNMQAVRRPAAHSRWLSIGNVAAPPKGVHVAIEPIGSPPHSWGFPVCVLLF
jgi:pimeloyl-ACP methyl ester carboxylesterase